MCETNSDVSRGHIHVIELKNYDINSGGGIGHI